METRTVFLTSNRVFGRTGSGDVIVAKKYIFFPKKCCFYIFFLKKGQYPDLRFSHVVSVGLKSLLLNLKFLYQ